MTTLTFPAIVTELAATGGTAEVTVKLEGNDHELRLPVSLPVARQLAPKLFTRCMVTVEVRGEK